MLGLLDFFFQVLALHKNERAVKLESFWVMVNCGDSNSAQYLFKMHLFLNQLFKIVDLYFSTGERIK